jgi:hypothetical protein
MRLEFRPRFSSARKNSKFRIPNSKLLSFVLASLLGISAATQQTFTGRLSDSMCGASHHSTGLSDRQCLYACVNRLAQYVLVDQDNRVVPIANQDAKGLPLYAGRPVKITGEREGDAIVVSKVEAIPAHLHVGHVMTNWRDTPGSRGFLPVAADEARVAVLHARLAARAGSLDDIKLHAGHVLNALDPAIERTGPGAGYGVRRAATGALQHLELATGAEGATANVKQYAAQASTSLSQALELVDQAVAAAEHARSAGDAADAAHAAADLAALTARLSDEALRRAQAEMTELLKSEGLLGAPR